MTNPQSALKLEHMSDQIIRASEIGEYIYCQRAWWLKRFAGYTSENVHELQLGTTHHEAHGKTVERAGQASRLGLIFLLAALLAFIVWFLS